MKPRLWIKLATLLIAAVLAACGGPDEKKMKFYNKGTALYEQGDYVKAVLEFKNAVQIDPKFADAHFMLGMVELKKGSWKKAFGRFSKTVALDPDHLDAHAQLGRLFFAGKAVDKALEKAEFILGKDPHRVDGLMLKASALFVQKKYDPCQEALVDVFKADPAHGDAFLLYARLKLAKKDIKGAEELLRSGIQAIPENIFLRLSLAELYTREKKTAEAEKVYQEIITLKPEVLGYKGILARFYAGIGEAAKAENTLRGIIDADPANPDHRILMARFLVSQKRAEEAEAVLKEAVTKEPEGTRALFALGAFYFQRSRPDQALETFQKIVDRDATAPDALRAKNQMARVHFSQKEYSAAQQLLSAILEENPGDLQAHSLMGDLALLRGDGHKAVGEFRTLVQADPASAPAYLNLARGHLLNNETELARENLKKALGLNPDMSEARRLLAKMYFRQGAFDQAKAELETILKKHPENLPALADLGDACAAKGKGPDAERYYREIVAHYPKNALGHYKLGLLRMRQKTYAQAVTAFDRALAIAPARRDIFAAQTQAFLAMGKADEAISRCKKCLAQSPEDAYVHNLLGEVYLSRKAYTKAATCFNRSIDLKPVSLIPYRNLTRTYAVQGKIAEAITQLEARFKADPKNMRLAFLLGVLCEHTNDLSGATAYYQQVVDAAPEFTAALNNLAFLIAEAGGSGKEMDKALTLVLKAAERHGDEPQIVDTLGWVYFHRGEYDKAYAQFQKLVDKGADNPILNYHLGMVLYKQGRRVEARKLLEKALEKPAKYVDVKAIEEALKEH